MRDAVLETDEMQHRAEDQEPLHIDRRIPLPWLLSIVGAVALQAVLMWNAQSRQADAIDTLVRQVQQQSELISKLTSEVGTKNLKDLEHDMQIKDLERRLGDVEGRRK